MTAFKLPDLGEGLEEAEIVHWHASVGDRVAADQPLVSVETEKAVVEIPAPIAGRIVSLAGKIGDIVKVGAVLAEIEPAGKDNSTAMVGVLEPPAGPPSTAAPLTHASPRESGVARAKAAPAVRQRAQALGVDVSSVHGTGPDGAITREDVEAAAKLEPESLDQGFTPLRGVRRAMSRAMARAGRSIVPATVTEEADVTRWPGDAEITLLAVEAIIAAAKAEPSLNATFDGARDARRLNENVDIGVAVDTQDGLIVPVLRTGKHQGRDKLRAELRRLIEGANDRRLTREELKDATITVSNFGSLGGLFAGLVVVPPQVAILGIGRIREMKDARDEVMNRWLPLSLTFDHRAVTGGEAARFINRIKSAIESAK